MKQICTRCIMDSEGDPYITFNADRTCNYCTYAIERMDSVYFPNKEGERKLDEMLRMLKEEGKNKKYDCVMGISGGLDSAYLAYLGAKKWGLRILAVHIDDGFNAPIAEKNIENLCKECNIKLHILTPDSEQYFDLTRSFLLAGVPGICIPQDNVLVAELFKLAEKNDINYFLSGTNFALESVLQRGNMHNASDLTHIKAIHKQFGTKKIDKLPLLSLFDRYIKYKYIKKQHYLRPLDWIDYNRDRAIEVLKTVGFNYYEGKHYENILTKFLQVYYMPLKFNIDIRKSHISSLIVSGQMTRDEAIKELEKPLFKEETMQQELNIILEKLNLTLDQFDKLMASPPKQHTDYKVSWLISYSDLARKYRKYLSD